MVKHHKQYAVLVGALGLLLGLQAAPALAQVQHHPTALPKRQVLLPKASAAKPAGAVVAHPALWKVVRGDTVIYLFGTVHALPSGVDWLNGPLAKAFDASGGLVTEILETPPEEMRKIVFAKAMLPEGQALRDGLPAKTRAALEKALKANGLPAGALDRYRPWYAAVAISTLPLMKSGYDPANGADAKLGALAKEKGLPREAVETAEYQLGLFDSLPAPLQRQYLTEVAVGAPKIVGELGAMIAAWRRGDAAGLARLMNADESDARLSEVLLIGRNRLWAKWIKDRLEKPKVGPKTLFMAVGAGHLAGKGSVQDQLKAMGIKAIRVQ